VGRQSGGQRCEPETLDPPHVTRRPNTNSELPRDWGHPRENPGTSLRAAHVLHKWPTVSRTRSGRGKRGIVTSRKEITCRTTLVAAVNSASLTANSHVRWLASPNPAPPTNCHTFCCWSPTWKTTSTAPMRCHPRNLGGPAASFSEAPCVWTATFCAGREAALGALVLSAKTTILADKNSQIRHLPMEA